MIENPCQCDPEYNGYRVWDQPMFRDAEMNAAQGQCLDDDGKDERLNRPLKLARLRVRRELVKHRRRQEPRQEE